MKYMEILNNCVLFNGLTEDEINMFFSSVSHGIRAYKKGEFIMHAGDKTESLGLLLNGSALVVQEDVWGNRNIITNLKCCDFFGEVFASLGNIPLNVSVEANEDCQVLFINMSSVFSSDYLCKSKINYNLIKILSRKILVYNDKVTHLSKRKTKDKILSYLSAESVRCGSFEFDIPFNRRELADYLCVERSAMTVELLNLQKAGIIKINKNHFKLLNVNADRQ